MTEIVIIGRNEGWCASDMLARLPKEWTVRYVADRCTDDTISTLERYGNVDIIDTTPFGLEGRQTSFCRNLGLSACDAASDVLFLDGDRYPVEGSIEDAIAGRRKDTEILLLPLFEDARTDEFVQENYGKVINGFYSCGVWLCRDTIDKVLAFQGGKQLFREDMQSMWGIEDTYLGDVCFHLGRIVELSDKVRLRGRFEKNRLDSLDALEKRFIERDKLNVVW